MSRNLKRQSIEVNEPEPSTSGISNQQNLTTCRNSSDKFCYMCGLVLFESNRYNITENITSRYETCYSIKIPNKREWWISQCICNACRLSLNRWNKNKITKNIKYESPMQWRKRLSNHSNCYFCYSNISSIHR